MTVDTKTRLVSADSVSPNPWNPNLVPEPIMEALVTNIKRHGMLQSITVREVETPGEGGPTVSGTGNYEIVDGEHRWRAAKLAGHRKVWATVSTMSRDEARAETLAMNHLKGEMDPHGVGRILQDLQDEGAGFADLSTFIGYSVPEMESFVALLTPAEPDPVPDPEPGGESEWRTLSVTMPAEVYELVQAELERLKPVVASEYPFRALELMAANSAQTPLESFQA